MFFYALIYFHVQHAGNNVSIAEHEAHRKKSTKPDMQNDLIQDRVLNILKKLKSLYPDVKTQLAHKNPFELLVATILSAQCSDKQVNRVTPHLFKQLSTPADFATVPLSQIEILIRSTGFFHNKAKNIQNCARYLMDRYGGKVPDTLEELVTLPGVGRKTANVVLGTAFGIPGMVVDTHVSRISQRLGLTDHKDPVKIEFDLMQKLPVQEWNTFSLRLILFGRSTCKARRPNCCECPLFRLCQYAEKNNRRLELKHRNEASNLK